MPSNAPSPPTMPAGAKRNPDPLPEPKHHLMKINESYGQRDADGEITLIRLLPGPIERVWAFLLDSEKRGQWLASGSIEPKVGGKIELFFLHADLSDEKTPPAKYADMVNGHHMTGQVTQYEPPHLLSYTWEGEKESSEVIFRLTPEGEKVRLVVTHRRLADRDAEKSVASGWHAHLDVLIARLESAPPPPFWTRFTQLEAEYARLLSPK